MLFHKELSKFEELQIFCKSLSQKIKSEKGHSQRPYVRWEEGGNVGREYFTLVAVSLFRAEGSMEKHQAAIGMLILPHSIKFIL